MPCPESDPDPVSEPLLPSRSPCLIRSSCLKPPGRPTSDAAEEVRVGPGAGDAADQGHGARVEEHTHQGGLLGRMAGAWPRRWSSARSRSSAGIRPGLCRTPCPAPRGHRTRCPLALVRVTLLSATDARPDGADSIGTRIDLPIEVLARSADRAGLDDRRPIGVASQAGDVHRDRRPRGARRPRRSGCPPPAALARRVSRRAPQSRIAGSGRLHRRLSVPWGRPRLIESVTIMPRPTPPRFRRYRSLPGLDGVVLFRRGFFTARCRRAGHAHVGAFGEGRQLAAREDPLRAVDRYPVLLAFGARTRRGGW